MKSFLKFKKFPPLATVRHARVQAQLAYPANQVLRSTWTQLRRHV